MKNKSFTLLQCKKNTQFYVGEVRVIFNGKKAGAEVAPTAGGERPPEGPKEGGTSTEVVVAQQQSAADQRQEQAQQHSISELGDFLMETEVMVYTANIEDETMKSNIETRFEQKHKETWANVGAWEKEFGVNLIQFLNKGPDGLIGGAEQKDDKERLSTAAQKLAGAHTDNPSQDAEKLVGSLFDVPTLKQKLGDKGDEAIKKLTEIFKKSNEEINRIVKEEPGLTALGASEKQRAVWEQYRSFIDDQGNFKTTELDKAFKDNKVILPVEQNKIKTTLTDIQHAIAEHQLDPAIAEEVRKGGFVATIVELVKQLMQLAQSLGTQLSTMFGGVLDNKEKDATAPSKAAQSIFGGDTKMVITSNVGHRDIHEGRDFHPGLDIRVRATKDRPAHTTFSAPADGELIPGSGGGHGNYADLKLADGRVIRFGHLDAPVQKRGPIKAGEVIGAPGSTGTSTGDHLHIEMKDAQGNFLNPMNFFSEYLHFATGGSDNEGENVNKVDQQDLEKSDEFIAKLNEWKALWKKYTGEDKENFTPENIALISKKLAQEIAPKYNIPWQVMAAQALLESGNGVSTPGQNYFGMKASEGEAYVERPTTEVENGQKVARKANFAKHGSMQQSFEAYGKRITTFSRFKPALEYKDNPTQFLEAVAKAGYATNPNYVKEVLARARVFNIEFS